MKKWLILGVCFLTSVVFAGSSYNDREAFKALLNGEKTEKLSRKVIQFYVSHPKTAEYFYKGGDVIALRQKNSFKDIPGPNHRP